MNEHIRYIFLDRDGVLNEDDGYVHSFAHLRWIPGSREAVGLLSKQGKLLFVVTNQSGVARGFYTEQDVRTLHQAMNSEFQVYGGQIKEFFYCPHLPGAPIKRYDVLCNCRKPKPGMIQRAMAMYGICPEEAVLIGDSRRDMEAAKAAGIQGLLFPGGNLMDFILAQGLAD
ncbi:MAG: HAD family hydrolase [Dialister sp.]|nr:HAD family hydrolase [Dialister sp.]